MLDRDRYWDCLDQAMEASSNGQTDDALAWLDEALRANPSGAEAHNSRGEILWDNNRAEEAPTITRVPVRRSARPVAVAGRPSVARHIAVGPETVRPPPPGPTAPPSIHRDSGARTN